MNRSKMRIALGAIVITMMILLSACGSIATYKDNQHKYEIKYPNKWNIRKVDGDRKDPLLSAQGIDLILEEVVMPDATPNPTAKALVSPAKGAVVTPSATPVDKGATPSPTPYVKPFASNVVLIAQNDTNESIIDITKDTFAKTLSASLKDVKVSLFERITWKKVENTIHVIYTHKVGGKTIEVEQFLLIKRYMDNGVEKKRLYSIAFNVESSHKSVTEKDMKGILDSLIIND